MAGKWQGFDEAAMLQFDAVKDGRTTELCARLHGTILPKSHSFWKTYYLPNHFNCRSTVRQVYGKAATKENDVPNADIPKMFQTNLGDDGLIFPENHAYFKDLPKEIMSFGSANYVKDNLHSSKGAVYESGLAYRHPTKLKTNISRIEAECRFAEHLDKRKVAGTLANYFNTDIFITPELSLSDYRHKFFFKNAPNPTRSPDYFFNNEFWEMKGHRGNFNYKKIRNMVNSIDEKRQAKNIIIRISNHQNLDIKNIERKILGEINGKRGLQNWIEKIIVVDDGMNIIPIK